MIVRRPWLVLVRAASNALIGAAFMAMAIGITVLGVLALLGYETPRIVALWVMQIIGLVLMVSALARTVASLADTDSPEPDWTLDQ